MSNKEAVIEMVKQMPDDATVDDIIARLYVRQQIEERIREVEAGEWVEHEEAKEQLSRDGSIDLGAECRTRSG